MNLSKVKKFIGNRLNTTVSEESNIVETTPSSDVEKNTILETIINYPSQAYDLTLKLFEEGRYQAAEPILKMLADTVDFPQAHLVLGSVYMNLGNKEHAEKYWLNAAEKHNLPQGHLALGHFYKLKDLAKSFAHFEKAFSDEKTKLKASTQLGLHYLEKREIEQAKNYFKEPAHHKDQEAYAGLGMIYVHENNRDLALQYFMQAPEVPLASYQIGLIFLKEEKYKRAISHLHKAADKYNIPAAHYVLGILYNQKDKIKEAKKYLHIAADYYTIAEAFLDLGRLYFQIREFNNAIHYLDSAATTHGMQAAYLPLGTIYRIQHNFDEAKKYLELALNDCKDGIAHIELGLLYHAHNNTEEAKKHLQISADEFKNPFAQRILESLQKKESENKIIEEKK